MAKILLDYVFPISVIPTVPEASTAFLKQVLVVAKPKTGQEGNVGTIYTCTTMTQVAARTDNVNAQQLFNAGMAKVYVLLADDLDLAESIEAGLGDFWTVLISDDFDDGEVYGEGGSPAVSLTAASIKIQDILYTAKTAGEDGNDITVTYTDDNTGGAATADATGSDITVSIEAGVTTAETIAAAIVADTGANALVTAAVDAGDEDDTQDAVTETNLEGGLDAAAAVPGDPSLDVGAFDGVVGYASFDADIALAFGADENRCGFFALEANGAKNMFYAFGKLLANLLNWTNQQYISMPADDGVDTLGDANTMFDNKTSFVIHDEEFGNRLALFVAGGKAIAAPYIGKNLRSDLQSASVSWIAANQPTYTLKNAALLETRLQEDVINQRFIATSWIEAGTIEVTLAEDNFVASGAINIAEPKALWRMFGEMRSTL